MSLHGFYSHREARPVEPSGSGDNWDADLARYRARQRRLSQRGKWRAVSASWTRDDGTYIDPDYYIVDWGQWDVTHLGNGSTS